MKKLNKIIKALLAFCMMLVPYFMYSQTLLQADGPGNTYELIRSKGLKLEVPDCYHNPPVKHVTEVYDSELQKNVFAFTMHIDIDKDRCRGTDRQRCELTVADSVPMPWLQAKDGETWTYTWKMKLDAGFKANSSFCHIHQLKAVSGDAGAPIVTLTTRTGSPDQLQLILSPGGTVKQTSLAPFKGTWVEVTETVTWGNSGKLAITIKRITDGATLFTYSGNADMGRDGYGNYRAKIGLYRSLSNASILRDETIRYADFCMAKGSVPCSGTGGTEVAPFAPVHLTATVLSNTQVRLVWKETGSNQIYYRGEYSSDGGATWNDGGTMERAWENWDDIRPSLTISGLTPGTTYQFRVRGENLYGIGPNSNIATAKTTGTSPNPTAPAAPSNLSASVASCSQINLSWSDNSSNESNFRIQRSSDGTAWSDLATVAANTTSYSNTGLAQTTRYYYRVCALNSAGSSAYTSSVNATTTSCTVTVQKIWLEAENGTLSSPMASYSDATASGGRYIMAPSGTNSSSSAPSSGYSTLSFSANSAGSYKLWFRTIMASTSTNSFYYRIDGGSWVSWNVDANVSTAWQWNSVATLTLSAGSHTLTVAYREGGTKLDRILLTNDAAYVPTGMGEGTPTTYDNIALEAENGTLSSPMASYSDAAASNGRYIMAPSGTNSSSSAPSSGYSTLSFTAAGGSYKMWFRTIMASTSTNSFYYRIDGGSWVSWNVDANVSTAWQWNLVSSSLTLSAGSHTLTIAYREGGTKLDMIAISNDPAYNPSVLKSAVAVSGESDQLIVSPNPAKSDKVSVKFNVPKSGNVKLFVRNSLGQTVANVVSAILAEGQYTEVLDASSLPNGIYYVTLVIDNKPVTVKLSIVK